MCRKSLEEQLFLLDTHLSPALLKVRGDAETIDQKQLMAAIDPKKPYTLEDFKDCHIGKMLLVSAFVVQQYSFVIQLACLVYAVGVYGFV